MPKFTELDPAEVQVGRGRGAALLRAPFVAALRAADAGKIELEDGEKAAATKRVLQDSAKKVGKRIRSSFDEAENALYWKRVGA